MTEHHQITTQQAAELVHVHPGTIRRWLISGKLAGSRVGGTYRTTAAAVASMIRPAANTDQESK